MKPPLCRVHRVAGEGYLVESICILRDRRKFPEEISLAAAYQLGHQAGPGTRKVGPYLIQADNVWVIEELHDLYLVAEHVQLVGVNLVKVNRLDGVDLLRDPASPKNERGPLPGEGERVMGYLWVPWKTVAKPPSPSTWSNL